MSGRTGVVQHYRSTVANSAPPANTLLDGEIGIEQANPMKLWVGVPVALDPTGRKLLYNQGAAVAGVTSFNTRTGAVTLTLADVTGVGGAPINAPLFTGDARAVTPAVADNDTSIATTAFVKKSAIAAGAVTSFNTRVGAVTLNATDVSNATGLLRTGGTMTGFIVTNANATLPLHLVPLQQMQAADNLLQQQIDLLAEDMYFVGGLNVATNVGNYTIASGIADGPLPAPIAAYKGFYVIVTTGGPGGIGNIPGGPAYVPADWIVCDGAQWIHLTMGISAVTAPMVAMSPVIGALGANVQTSIAWLNTNKLNLAGGTMTGLLTLSADPTAVTHAATKRYVDTKAPLASPAFTGIPTAPTAAPGTSTLQIASTAFVGAAVAAGTAGVASWNTRTGAVTMTLADVTGVGGAPIANPIFTGDPRITTDPAAADNDTSIPSTRWVRARLTAGSISVAVDGTSILGNGLTATPLRVGVINGGTW